MTCAWLQLWAIDAVGVSCSASLVSQLSAARRPHLGAIAMHMADSPMAGHSHAQAAYCGLAYSPVGRLGP